jgi:hypothetical protein
LDDCARKQASDVAQTFPPRQLCERKTAKLIEARETLDLALTVIAIHAATERRQRQMIHDLGKDELTLRHDGNLATSGMPGNAIKTILESRPEQNLCSIRDLS